MRLAKMVEKSLFAFSQAWFDGTRNVYRLSGLICSNRTLSLVATDKLHVWL